MVDDSKNDRYLEVINTFAMDLLKAHTMDEIIWSITNQAIQTLGFYDCVIFLYDKKKKALVLSSVFGPKSPKNKKIENPTYIKPGEGIVGDVFLKAKSEIVNDTSKDKRYIIDDFFRYSELTVPIFDKNQNVIGIIDSEHPEKNFFSKEDEKILNTIASMLSTKIEQANANQELNQYKENLERLISEKTKELEIALENLSNTNKTLQDKNNETEFLLKEIHHRVKNNMQIIISLLNIQSNHSTSKKEKEVFLDFTNRVRSMSLIHEQLYFKKNISKIQTNDYIFELSNTIIGSYKSDKDIYLSIDVDPFHIGVDTAIPMGLLINELMTNSIKHAFPNQKDAKISINLDKIDSFYRLVYKDNGIGFDFLESKSDAKNFGMEMIEILIDQLNAKIQFEIAKGSIFTIDIPAEHESI